MITRAEALGREVDSGCARACEFLCTCFHSAGTWPVQVPALIRCAGCDALVNFTLSYVYFRHNLFTDADVYACVHVCVCVLGCVWESKPQSEMLGWPGVVHVRHWEDNALPSSIWLDLTC